VIGRWPAVRTAPREETATATPKFVRVMDRMRSRTLGLKFDLARPGVKTGPYGGNGKFEDYLTFYGYCALSKLVV
jgi:hypothetical protein